MSRAGRFRHQIVIQKNTPVQSASGAAVESWSTFATVFAGVEPVKGREYFGAGRINAETTHLIVLRWLAGVDETMRIAFDGRVFDIQAVINKDERDRDLELTCVERKNQ